jgi:hypothetical protein
MTKRRKASPMTAAKIILICGPTRLIEVGGFRRLTDPTFDAPVCPIDVFPNRHQVGRFRSADQDGSCKRSRS